MAGNNVINVDVAFRPLDASLSTLKNALANVAEDSQFGKNLARQIADIEPRLAKLRKQASAGIFDDKGLARFNSEFDGLNRRIENASNSLSRLKLEENLKNIKLSPDLAKEAEQIATIMKNINTQKKEIQKGMGGKAYQQLIDSNIINKEGVIQIRDKNSGKSLGNVASGRTIMNSDNIGSLTAEFYNRIASLSSIIGTANDTIQNSVRNQQSAFNTALENFKVAFNRATIVDDSNGKKTRTFGTNDAYSAFLSEAGFNKGRGKSILESSMQKVGYDISGGYNSKQLVSFIQGVINNAAFEIVDKATGRTTGYSDNKLTESERLEVMTALQGGGTARQKYYSSLDVAKDSRTKIDVYKPELESAQAGYAMLQKVGSQQENAQRDLNTQLANYQSQLDAVYEKEVKRMQIEQRQADVLRNLSSAQKVVNIEEEKNKARKQGEANFNKSIAGLQSYIGMWLSLNAVLRTVRQGVNYVKRTVLELDQVITKIAIVTNMTQKDLWNQMSNYTNMAKTYGVSIKGAYEVSQIFYQQGLTTSNVMAMTTETLKMAKIAGLDYSLAADYMTVAVKAFKIEMSEANRVTDTYSALAASAATDVRELATAMSKTASSAASVGASFENTSAILTVMIANTRESAENLGSALKSIISRYGTLKTDVKATQDEDGQDLNYNDVDKALKSVGITLKDTTGQFRNFDEVIVELAEKWDTLDTLSQRYIATQLAGNRQQSRLLAVLSDAKGLKDAIDTANNAEDASIAQTLKTLDSIETKITNLKSAFESAFLGTGQLRDIFKSVLEYVTNIINNLKKMGAVGAITTLVTLFTNIRATVNVIIESLRQGIGTVAEKIAEITQQREFNINTKLNNEQAEAIMRDFTNRYSTLKINADASGITDDIKNKYITPWTNGQAGKNIYEQYAKTAGKNDSTSIGDRYNAVSTTMGLLGLQNNPIGNTGVSMDQIVNRILATSINSTEAGSRLATIGAKQEELNKVNSDYARASMRADFIAASQKSGFSENSTKIFNSIGSDIGNSATAFEQLSATLTGTTQNVNMVQSAYQELLALKGEGQFTLQDLSTRLYEKSKAEAQEKQDRAGILEREMTLKDAKSIGTALANTQSKLLEKREKEHSKSNEDIDKERILAESLQRGSAIGSQGSIGQNLMAQSNYLKNQENAYWKLGANSVNVDEHPVFKDFFNKLNQYNETETAKANNGEKQINADEIRAQINEIMADRFEQDKTPGETVSRLDELINSYSSLMQKNIEESTQKREEAEIASREEEMQNIEDSAKGFSDAVSSMSENLNKMSKNGLTKFSETLGNSAEEMHSKIANAANGTTEGIEELKEALRGTGMADDAIDQFIKALQHAAGKIGAEAAGEMGSEAYDNFVNNVNDARNERPSRRQKFGKMMSSKGAKNISRLGGAALTATGTYLMAKGLGHEDTYEELKKNGYETSKVYTGFGGLASAAGSVATGFAMGGPVGALVSAVTQLPNIINSVSQLIDGYSVDIGEKLSSLSNTVQNKKNNYLKEKNEANNIKASVKKYMQLRDAQYESADALKEYKEYIQEFADSYPDLVSTYNAEGEAVLNLSQLYNGLADSYREAIIAKGEYESANSEYKQLIYENLGGTGNRGGRRGKTKFTTKDESGLVINENGAAANGTLFIDYNATGMRGAWRGDREAGWEAVYNAAGELIEVIGEERKTITDENGEVVKYTWANSSGLVTHDNSSNWVDSIWLGTTDFVDSEGKFNQSAWFDILAGYGKYENGAGAERFQSAIDDAVNNGTIEGTFATDFVVGYAQQMLETINDEETLKAITGGAGAEAVGQAIENRDIKALSVFFKNSRKWFNEAGQEFEEAAIAMSSSATLAADFAKQTKAFETTGQEEALAYLFGNNFLYEKVLEEYARDAFRNNNDSFNYTDETGAILTAYKGTDAYETYFDQGYRDWINDSTNRDEVIEGYFREFSSYFPMIADMDKVLSTASDYRTYRNSDEMRIALELELGKEIADSDFGKAILEQAAQDYDEATKSATTYLQTSLIGTEEARRSYRSENISLRPLTIASFFDDNLISSSFADDTGKMWNQFVAKKDNAGLFTEAGLNAEFMENMLYTATQMQNGEDAAEFLDVLMAVDLTASESIQNAIDAYTEILNNPLSSTEAKNAAEQAINYLNSRLKTLLVNTNTVINETAEALDGAETSSIDLIKVQTKGLDSVDSKRGSLKTGADAVASLNSKLGTSYTFDDIFTWSNTVGDYVYSTLGMQESLRASNEEIQKSIDFATQQADTARRFFDNINFNLEDFSIEENLGQDVISDFWGFGQDVYSEENAEDIRKNLLFGNAMLEDPEQRLLQEEFIDSMLRQWSESGQTWEEFIASQAEQHVNDYAMIQQLEKAGELYLSKNQQKNAYENIDFSKIVSGTSTADEIAEQNNNLRTYLILRQDSLRKIAEEENRYWDEWNIDGLINLISQGGREAAETYKQFIGENEFDFSTAQNILKANSSRYNTAIKELLEGPNTAISETTSVLLVDRANGAALLNSSQTALVGTAEAMVNEAVSLYNELENSFLNGETTLSELNASAVSILEARVNKEHETIGALNLANSFDFSGITSILEAYGKEVSDVFDLNTGDVKDGITSIKSLGGGNFEITEFDNFVSEVLGIEIDEATKASAEYIDAYASYISGRGQKSATSAFGSLVQNPDEVSADAIAGIAKIYGISYEAAKDWLNAQDNGDGTYKVKPSDMSFIYDIFNGEITDTIKNSIASIIDAQFSAATAAISAATRGANSSADIQSYINTINGYITTDDYKLNLSDFQYDAVSGTMIMKNNDKVNNALQESSENYTEGLVNILTEMGMTAKEAIEYIEDLQLMEVQDELRDIDIDSAFGNINSASLSQLQKSVEKFILACKAVGLEVSYTADDIVEKVKNGGMEAIEALQIIADARGDILTTEDYRNAFESSINTYRSIADELNNNVGAVVGKDARDVLDDSGYVLEEIGDSGTFIVTEVGNLGKALKKYYDGLKTTLGATIEEINEAAINWITEMHAQNTSITAVMKSAADFSIDDLANIMNSFGLDLGLMFNEFGEFANGYESAFKFNDATGNLQVVNWSNFMAVLASQMNVDVETLINKMGDDYLTAYSDWVDDFIGRRQAAADNIKGLGSDLASAQNGDILNLSFLEKIYGSTQDTAEALQQFGIEYIDGVGTIKNLTVLNFQELISDISSKAKDNEELSSAVSELQDTLLDTIDGYIDILKKGLTGDLGYFDADTLMTAFGIDPENFDKVFTATGKGLQISASAARDIYLQLKEVDYLASQIMLEELIEGAELFGDGIENASDLLREITNTTKKIADNTRAINILNEDSEGRALTESENKRLAILQQETNELQKQLSLYNDMRVKMLDNPDAWKLSDQDLSNPIQAALNAWGSAGDWMKALNDAGKSGDTHNMMGVQDFTNMIHFVADTLGEDAAFFKQAGMNASEMIQAGYAAIKSVDGSEYVDLSGIGVNFLSGANNMGDSVTEGINTLADSQIEMLDGLIGMLEVIVAMEQIGDITADGISVDELFNDIINIDGTSYTGISEYLLTLSEANEDLKAGLETVMFGDQSVYYWLQHPDEMSANQKIDFAAFMTNFFEEFGNLDSWDPDSVSAIWDKFKNTTIDGFEAVFQNGINFTDMLTGINWTFDESKVSSKLLSSLGLTMDEVSAAVAKAATGKELTVNEKLASLVYSGAIEFKDGKYYVTDENGNKSGPLTAEEARAKIPEIIANQKKESGLLVGDGPQSYENANGETVQTITYHTEKGANAEVTEEINLDTGEITYLANGSGEYAGLSATGTSEKQAIDNLVIAAYNKKNELENDNAVTDINNISKSAQSQLRYEVGATATVRPVVEVDSDNVNFGSMDHRTKGLEAVRKTAEELAANLTETADGWTIDIGGVQYTANGENAEQAAQAIQEQIAQDLNIETQNVDAAISATVTGSGDLGIINLLNKAQQGVPLTANLGVNVQQNPGSETPEDGATSSLTPMTQSINVVTEGSGEIFNKIQSGGGELPEISQKITVTTVKKTEGDGEENGGDTSSTETVTTSFETAIDTSGITDAATAVSGAVDTASGKLGELADSIGKLESKTISAQVDFKIGGTISAKISADPGATVTPTVTADEKTSKTTLSTSGANAKGNVALAGGNAGKTLMGELGPELVVSNGRYFTVGNNGAEFVDLPRDAIVFNHQQTANLLGGKHVGHGKPVVSEEASIALAGGNVGGPAMASAQAALSALKELRAMWAALKGASAKDLGRKAGGGSGGGGGDDAGAFIGDLERWYNLLQQIDTLEQDITSLEKARQNLIHSQLEDGRTYIQNLQKSLKLLGQEVEKYTLLRDLAYDYQQKRIDDLNNSEYGKILKVLDDGTVQYQDEGFKLLAELNATKSDGVTAKYSAKQQLAMIKKAGFNMDLLKTKSDGTKAEKAEDQVQVFWDNIDTWKEELEGLRDSVVEYSDAIEDAAKQIHDIRKELIDFQLGNENMLMTALTDKIQSSIDDLNDEIDKIKNANEDYVKGLNDALDKEKSMYDQQQKNADLTKLQRQLAILQRTGGSASEIKALQDQIASKMQDSYFDMQQQKMDQLQEAVDKQIEELQKQVDLQTQALEYQKENGILWGEVYDMMNNWNEGDLGDFIQAYTKDLQSKSALDVLTTMNDNLVLVQKWLEMRDQGGIESIMTEQEKLIEEAKKTQGKSDIGEKKEAYQEWLKGNNDYNIARSTSQNAQDKFDSAEKLQEASVALREQVKGDYGASSNIYKLLDKLVGGSVTKKERDTIISELDNYIKDEKTSQEVKDAAQSVKDFANNLSFNKKGASTSNINGNYNTASNNLKAATATDRQYQLTNAYQDNYVSTNEEKAALDALFIQDDITNAMRTPYSNSSTSKDKLQKWTNSKGSSVTGALPENTVLEVVGFTGDKSVDKIKANYYDARGNKRTGYFKGFSKYWTEEQLNAIRKFYPDGKLPQYLHGGLVDYTGPAWVDGSKSKPEAFLSASDTELLKSKIFSNSDYSLKSAIASIAELSNSIAKANESITNNSGITFGNVNITLESGTISNDYDARRAGTNIMEQMMNIARKSGNIGLTR